MDKKFLASIAFMVAVAMLSACGSQDLPGEAAPPDYSKYPNIDNPNNNTESTASDIDAVGNIMAGIIFTGTLENTFLISEDADKDLISVNMDIDYYKLLLKRYDSLSITVSNYTSPFRFRFYGPCHVSSKSECADTTVVVNNKTASLKYYIKAGHENGLAGEKATFHIKVFNSLEDLQQNSSYEPNPYLITVKVTYRE
jgi:hypothetical protein